MTSKKNIVLRLAVGDPNGPRSGVWRLWLSNGEVYLAHNGLGGIGKLSFHSSRICRSAFTQEYGTPKGMTDRAMTKWVRSQTVPGRSALEFCRGD